MQDTPLTTPGAALASTSARTQDDQLEILLDVVEQTQQIATGLQEETAQHNKQIDGISSKVQKTNKMTKQGAKDLEDVNQRTHPGRLLAIFLLLSGVTTTYPMIKGASTTVILLTWVGILALLYTYKIWLARSLAKSEKNDKVSSVAQAQPSSPKGRGATSDSLSNPGSAKHQRGRTGHDVDEGSIEANNMFDALGTSDNASGNLGDTIELAGEMHKIAQHTAQQLAEQGEQFQHTEAQINETYEFIKQSKPHINKMKKSKALDTITRLSFWSVLIGSGVYYEYGAYYFRTQPRWQNGLFSLMILGCFIMLLATDHWRKHCFDSASQFLCPTTGAATAQPST